MGCPFTSGGDEDESTARRRADRDGDGGGAGLDRRSFMKSALMIGGTSALATSLDTFGIARRAAAATMPEDPPTIADRANRQHAWDAYESFSEAKETSIPPSRHLFLLANYQGDGRPSEADRRTVGRAFDALESLLEWSSDGLLFTVGYSPAYFDRYEEDLPLGIEPDSEFDKPGLLRPQDLIDIDGVTLDRERPVEAETYDVAIHLSSNHEENLLAAEQLLWGGSVDIDGDGEEEPLNNTLEGIFTQPTEYPERRVGFAGAENLIEEGSAGEEGGAYPEDVPVNREDGTDAKLSMGFNDLFRNSIPRETNATMVEEQQLVHPKPPGAFAQGTIQHLSKLDMNLDPEGHDPGFEDDPAGTGSGWYQYDAQQRADRMFSPDHDVDEMGVVGEDLGNSNAPVASGGNATPMRDLDGEDVAEQTQQDAESEGVVGHVQKCARARFDLNERLTDVSGTDYASLAEEVQTDESDEMSEYDDLRGHDGDQQAEQVVLRRDVDTTDEGRPGNHFMALMRFNPYMAYMRQAVNGVAFDSSNFGLDGDAQIQHDDITDAVDDGANGIVDFMETKRRGNFVVPPLRLRALPPAQTARPPMVILSGDDGASLDSGTVEVVVGAGTTAPTDADLESAADAFRAGEATVDRISEIADEYRAGSQLVSDGYERDPRNDQPEEYGGPGDIETNGMGTIRFGPRRAVNAGGGASPTSTRMADIDGDGTDELVLTFDATDPDLSFTGTTQYARLYAETTGGFPVFATAPVDGTTAADARSLRRRLATGD